MDETDLRAMELVCSRLCHDLVGPVAAVNNGIELIGELGVEDGGEAIDLIARSGQVAAARLKLFRFAFGAAGSGENLSPGLARDALVEWFAGGKVALEGVGSGKEPPPALMKMVVLMCLLAEEALPQGGRIVLNVTPSLVRLEATGPRAGLRDEVREILAGKGGPPSPRTSLAWFALTVAALRRQRFSIQEEVGGRIVGIVASD